MAIGFGIIGTGMIANFHAAAIGEISGAKLLGCFNPTVEKANAFGEKYGCTAHTQLKDMLADPAIDVVTVCSPSGAHLEPGLAAAKAGKHVLIEKPLEVTLPRCDKLIAACDAAGVQLGTIFPSRYHPAAIQLKKAVDAGRFGVVSLADAYVKWYRSQAYYDSGAWRGTWKLDGGGALMNQAIHTVDLLLWLMGPVEQVTAQAATRSHQRIEVEDVVVATLKFASGALGVIEATTGAYPGALKKIEIAGHTGSAILEEETLVQWQFAKEKKSDESILAELSKKTESGGGAGDPSAIKHVAHRELFKDFLRSIKAGKPNNIDGREGRRSVELILAIYKAAKTNRPVKL